MTKEQSNKSSASTTQAVTLLLQSTQAGDKQAINDLLPLVYNEMRNIAHQKLKFERQGHTLDTTALVHEAYFKLIDHDKVEWQSRAHFLGVAAMAMKRILINYAEQRNAIKRGADFSKADLEMDKIEGNIENMSKGMAEEILALESALKRMKEFNERGSRVIDYHFFGGLSWKEISEIMGIAPVTVRRTWYSSRLWLRREMETVDLPQISVKSPGQ